METTVNPNAPETEDKEDIDTATEYIDNINNALDAEEELSAFRVDNQGIYNAVKKMLAIAVTQLADEDDDDSTEDNPEVIVPAPEVVVTTDGVATVAAAPSPEAPANQAIEIKGATVVKVRLDDTAPDQGNPAPSDMPKIDRYAVPPRATANSAKPAGGDDTFTASEIHNFYKDVVRGRYKGREKEADALEARIFRAVKEGRVSA